MWGLKRCTAELLNALQGLSGLHTLAVSATAETLTAVCQLTGLRDLDVALDGSAAEDLMLQLTQLRQLTSLRYDVPIKGGYGGFVELTSQVS
jgi:hypothetical protein